MAYDPWVVQPKKKVPTIPWIRGTGGTGTAMLPQGRSSSIFAPQAPSGPQPRGNPYAGLLQDYMNQQRADFAAESAADKGGMINALRKYIISYGASPNFEQFGGIGGDAAGYLKEAMDANTMALARKAEEEGLSSHARLAEQNARATRLIPAALAARGILRSGQTGSDLADQAMQYKRAGYDMLSELMGGVTGSVSNFQAAERQRQRALADAEMQAAWQAMQDWGDSYFDTGSVPSPAQQVAAIASGAARNRGFPVTSSGPLSRTNPKRQRNYLNARVAAGRM